MLWKTAQECYVSNDALRQRTAHRAWGTWLGTALKMPKIYPSVNFSLPPLFFTVQLPFCAQQT